MALWTTTDKGHDAIIIIQRAGKLARETFWGDHAILDHYLRWLHAYSENGQRYPSNGETLATYIYDVTFMAMQAAGTLELLCRQDLANEITRQSKYWGMMRCDIWADMFGRWIPYPGDLLY